MNNHRMHVKLHTMLGGLKFNRGWTIRIMKSFALFLYQPLLSSVYDKCQTGLQIALIMDLLSQIIQSSDTPHVNYYCLPTGDKNYNISNLIDHELSYSQIVYLYEWNVFSKNDRVLCVSKEYN